MPNPVFDERIWTGQKEKRVSYSITMHSRNSKGPLGAMLVIVHPKLL